MTALEPTASYSCDSEAQHIVVFFLWDLLGPATWLCCPDIPPNMVLASKTGPGRNYWPDSPNDIYVCIKRFAADDALSQDPNISLQISEA